MFEQASRLKLRFNTNGSGYCATEDLWDLPLESTTKINLYSIGNAIHKELSEVNSSIFTKKKDVDVVMELRFEIVKHIIEVKTQEIADSKNASAIKERNQLIMGVIKEKEMDELKGKSIKQLKKELE